MVQVGDTWNLAGLDGPPLRFLDRRSGHGVRLAIVDVETGKRISAKDVTVEAGTGADDLTRWRVGVGLAGRSGPGDPE